jgi:hypothetical protein
VILKLRRICFDDGPDLSSLVVFDHLAKVPPGGFGREEEEASRREVETAKYEEEVCSVRAFEQPIVLRLQRQLSY